jgi:hypothetical protein
VPKADFLPERMIISHTPFLQIQNSVAATVQIAITILQVCALSFRDFYFLLPPSSIAHFGKKVKLFL